ncbi:hypothetical protein YPPY100_1710, partial [Yersinia pestis PY-100]
KSLNANINRYNQLKLVGGLSFFPKNINSSYIIKN